MKSETKKLREEERSALKDKHRAEILASGMRLCLERGVADVDMKEIAAAARVSRATLYRYFPSKKLLVYEILRWQAEANAEGYHAARQSFAGNGFEKFSQFVAQLVDAYRAFPDMFRFMGMVDFYYCSKDSSEDLIELYQDVFYSLLVEETPQVYLEEGQRDGSVRADIDPRVYTATVIAALVSLAEQITANKETTQALYGVGDADAMMEVAAGAFVARAKK
ncbi:MAG TPA: TetR/AcrR family transcriptional regulator [Anaerolineales bacterium]|nr:TetR/AcrR family transcriptional regulator [Anaerolineales bacterium]